MTEDYETDYETVEGCPTRQPVSQLFFGVPALQLSFAWNCLRFAPMYSAQLWKRSWHCSKTFAAWQPPKFPPKFPSLCSSTETFSGWWKACSEILFRDTRLNIWHLELGKSWVLISSIVSHVRKLRLRHGWRIMNLKLIIKDSDGKLVTKLAGVLKTSHTIAIDIRPGPAPRPIITRRQLQETLNGKKLVLKQYDVEWRLLL